MGLEKYIKYNKERKPSIIPALRNDEWFKKDDIVYCFLEEKTQIKRGKVISINKNSLKIRINNSVKEMRISDPALLRPEDFFSLVMDPIIHLRGWLGACNDYSEEFKRDFKGAIFKKRKVFRLPNIPQYP